ncbi:MAG TPA: dihydrofolate reductase family protein [Candidatus Tyrphobacter sp.]|nr:dihydrofolate reductase family protein [Candidatus Tyrphobacter sp.]
MEIFIIAVLSADGFLAENKGQAADWSSSEDKKFFARITKEAGVVVMGSATFKTLGRPLKDRLNVVYSRTQSFEGVETTQLKPDELLADLEKRGYTKAAIIGGPSIYTLFMEAGLVQKLYLTIEPVSFGQGLTLFTKPIKSRLRLVSVQELNENSVVLEYQVVEKII